MFKKLRNRLVAINIVVTTIVLGLSFSIIYWVAVISTQDRAKQPRDIPTFEAVNEDGETSTIDSKIFREVYIERITQERQVSLRNLLITLIVAGVAMEIVVALFSYFWANEAIKPVKKAYESQKIFISNASHEIKTPLAVIEANLEAADIQDNRWIENVKTETHALAELNANLLALTRADGEIVDKPEVVNVKNLLTETVDPFEPKLENKKLSVKCKDTEEIKASRADLVQLIRILLDNAIKYSKDKIIIEYKGRELNISNDGRKISDEQKQHIFDRFYQSDKSSEGVGLGLSIAKSLCDRNSWKISVSSDKLTKFTVKL